MNFYYFPTRPFKNVEDAVAYLRTLPGEEDEALSYDIAIEPPVEGQDFDVDDLNNDDVIIEENVNLLGSRLLAMPANITINTRSGERRQMDEPDTENAAPSLSGNQTKKSTTSQGRSKKRKVEKASFNWIKKEFHKVDEPVTMMIISHL